tara:strand:+ start:220 stop:537 length:318 start_codon:yes stop_codon:yes gene_type:complete
MWLQIKTSTGPYVFRSSDLKSIVTTGSTGLRFVFEGSNIQPKPTDVWVDFTHTADKGNDIVDLFWEWSTRTWKKDLARPVVLADKVNNIYFSNEISTCRITTPGS